MDRLFVFARLNSAETSRFGSYSIGSITVGSSRVARSGI